MYYIRLNLITITTANHMHHFPFSYIKLKIIEQFLSTYNYNLIHSCIHTIVYQLVFWQSFSWFPH